MATTALPLHYVARLMMTIKLLKVAQSLDVLALSKQLVVSVSMRVAMISKLLTNDRIVKYAWTKQTHVE